MKARARDAAFLSALCLLPLLWYGRELFTDANLMTDDLIAQYQPWWTYARDRILAGGFPLWNPYIFCGMPYHINPENLLFYPLKIPFMLFSFFKGAILLRVLHAMLASAGMYCLLRRWRLGAWPAVAGALMFTYGSFMSYEFIHIPYILVASWLPWELLALDKLIARPTPGRAIAVATVMALCFLGGSPGIFMIVQIMCGGVCLFLLIKPLWRHQWRRLFILCGTGLFSLALFLALAAVLLFPVLQFVQFSPRAGGLQNVETFIRMSIQPSLLKLLVNPLLHWLNGAPYPPIYPMQVVFLPYVGILGFLLAVTGLFSRRGTAVRPALLACAVLGILLALGNHAGLYPWLFQRVPILRWFRWPHDYLLLTYAALAMLAAFGLDTCLRLQQHRFSKWAAPACLLIAADLFLFGWGYRIAFPRNELAMAHLKGPLEFMAQHAEGERVSVSSPHGHMFFREQQAVFRTFPPRHANPGWLNGAWPSLAQWCNAHRSSEWHGFYDYCAALYPLWDSGTRHYPINAALMYQYPEICGYDPFMIERIAWLLGAGSVSQVWNACNVKYVATPETTVPAHLQLVCSNAFLNVYENTARLPRAFFPQSIQDGLNRAQAEACMQAAGLAPLQGTVVEDSVRELVKASVGEPQPAPVMISDHPERVILETDARSSALLVLHDPYYPGWRALIDGQETRILRANGAFRAVEVPPGRHRVEFQYRPALLFWMALLSASAWSMVLLAGGWSLRRRRHPPCTAHASQMAAPLPGQMPAPPARRYQVLLWSVCLLLLAAWGGAAFLSPAQLIPLFHLADQSQARTLDAETLKAHFPPGTFLGGADGGVRLYANTYWGYEITRPRAGRLAIRLVARGSPVQGTYPLLAITMDRKPPAGLCIDSNQWHTYQLDIPVSAGRHTLTFSYVNDYFLYPEDRNLDLRSIFIGD